ncbi:MAG: CPBP family intramembrane metalloprotease [Clostridia bacterium]|nr:CPBP family intramembrane metalloprotease [Clostridia bacterium]
MTARRAYNRVGLGLFVMTVIYIGLSYAVSYLLGNLAASGAESAGYTWLRLITSFAPLYLIAVPIGLLLMRTVPAPFSREYYLGAGEFFTFLLTCFPVMYAGNIIGQMISYAADGGKAQQSVMEFALDNHPVKIIIAVFLAPLIEEYVFRRQIIDRCSAYGEKQAILFSALSFGLFHMNFVQFFYAFGMGLIFGYVYTRTRRIRYSAAMHMIVNFMGSVIAPFILRGVDTEKLLMSSSGSLHEEEMLQMLPSLMGFMIYALAIFGLSVAGFVLLIVKARKVFFIPAAAEMPRGRRFIDVYCTVGVALFIAACAVMFFI